MTDEDKIETAAAWSDYRSDYGIPPGIDSTTAHALFMAGWRAHQHGDTKSVLR